MNHTFLAIIARWWENLTARGGQYRATPTLKILLCRLGDHWGAKWTCSPVGWDPPEPHYQCSRCGDWYE